ncbi:Gp15 family bacteriophage protein [Alkalihalophilus marmarensis]|uniref:Gp15 family bacteriophage protein n=1 Tax=Alkalihalophilus marmarensis TaxID=521377 RepID=UPI002E201676|nr:Gp15 family bacteriophage protein [Alkalihalophilus marmarensis]
MFNFAYSLDTTVTLDGCEYEIDMSFDNILRLFDLLNDKGITDEIQVETAIVMLFGFKLDCDIQTQSTILNNIFDQMIADGQHKGPEVDIEGNPMPEEAGEKPVYSLKQDAPFIYASFYQDYGIDLFEQQGKLDWRKFLALLDGLKGDTKFKEVIEIRTMELPTGKGSEKQREKVLKAKKAYELKE